MDEMKAWVGRRLKKLREEKGMSFRDLARATEIRYGNLWKIEEGKLDIRVSTLLRILNGLGVSWVDFAEDED